MRSQFIFVAMFGIGVASVGCSSSEPDLASDSADVTAKKDQGAERLEYVCDLPDGKIVEVHPSFSELHRIDLNGGKWAMEDGLSIETSASGVTISSDEGEVIATIDENLQFKEGATKGTCERLALKELKPSSASVVVDDTLEYSCEVQGGVKLVVHPEFGEISEIDANKGTYASYDGISFRTLILESLPPKTELAGEDEEGTAVASIIEGDDGVRIHMGELSGDCKKFQRTKKR